MSDDKHERRWVASNPGKTAFFVFVFCLFLVEGLVRVLVFSGLLPYERYPTSREPQFWAYIDPVVGMWRYSHASYVDNARCFTAVYTSNSVGARDRERSVYSDAPRRVVVLGDSFVEGHSFDESNRITDLLEQWTDIEHLNWGTAGGFGTIQEWLLYESKVKKYDHSDVMLFILPDNDFKDNDPNEFFSDVYRPYLRQTADDFEVYYPVSFEERFTGARTVSTILKNTLDNEIYILNILRWATRQLKDGFGHTTWSEAEPTYKRYDADDLAIFMYALSQLSAAVESRNLYLFLIPRTADMQYVQQRGYSFPLVRVLDKFSSEHDNVHFLDLLPGMLDHAKRNELDFDDYTLGCDSHWGKLGHEVAAKLVHDFVYGADGSPTQVTFTSDD